MTRERPGTCGTVSVVIPSYGGGETLQTTLRSVLSSETARLEGVEVIVVDDGSPEPVSPRVEECGRNAPMRLHTIRQDNCGPAAARNRGFRAAAGDVILFLDDDIEVPPDLLIRHVLAHQQWPRSVVWGRCALPSQPSSVRDVLEGLRGDDYAATEEYQVVFHVASGQLSVERELFAARGAVYAETLRTPAAEEYELAFRLRREGIPMVFASRIVALHHQSLDIRAVCQHQYKHGLGCAEAACRCPDTLALPELRRIIERTELPAKTLKGFAKRAGSGVAARRILLSTAGFLERLPASSLLLEHIYRAAIGAHFVGGVRDGLRLFMETAGQ